MRIDVKEFDTGGAALALRQAERSNRPFGAAGIAHKVAERSADRWADQSGLTYWWLDGHPLHIPHTVQPKSDLFAKRATDIVLSLMAIIALAPLMLMLAMLIKFESPGPVLFRQRREGLNGRTFEIYKFRSMRTDQCDASGVRQTKAGDERVTPLGRLMRQRNLDELPQLVNVLLGDMSLVGPRPHVANMTAGGTLYEELVPYYRLRQAMRPGLTGWAQANGLRGVTDDPITATARVDHDIAYIQNFSWWLDVNCILRTLKNEMFTGSGV
jgi:polysaccharide biosynthesis protein PslA